jgi:hypothetical protein
MVCCLWFVFTETPACGWQSGFLKKQRKITHKNYLIKIDFVFA